MYDIRSYTTPQGDTPFDDWLYTLDESIRSRIFQRLQRLAQGNFGDHKSVGKGVFELRFFFGSGYRVYYAKEEKQIVLLLCGGDKGKTQSKDIKTAQSYWQDHQERK